MKTIYIHQPYEIELENGQKKHFSDGLSYVKFLRKTYRNSEPILFTSFLSPSQLLQHIPNSKIVFAIGHLFLQLPFDEASYQEVVAKTQPLHDIQLNDIIMNFCEVRSSVRESFHIFKGKLSQIQHNNELSDTEKIAQIQAYFIQYEKELQKDTSDYPLLIQAYKEIVSKFDPSDWSTLDTIRNHQEESLTQYMPGDNENDSDFTVAPKNWEILFLDDRPDELQPIFKLLTEKNIKYHICTHVEDAIKLVNDDHLNKITVLVSDYRLFEDENSAAPYQMQTKQGYDFLLEVVKNHEHHHAMVALSGLSKWFLLDSFRKKQLDVKVYSKGGLLGGGHRLFVDDLEYLGDLQYEVLTSKPHSTNWFQGQRKTSIPMKSVYIAYRSHADYASWENEINIFAEKVARELEYLLDKDQPLNFSSIASPTNHGNVSSTFPGKNMEKDIITLKQKLKYRRVYFYLLLKGLDSNEIISILQYGKRLPIKSSEEVKELNKDKSKKSKSDLPDYIEDTTIRNLLLNLSISKELDIPSGLLVEEKYFLQHYMYLPLDEVFGLMEQSQILINEMLNGAIDQLPDTMQQYVFEGKIVLTSIFELPTFMDKLYTAASNKKISEDLFLKICTISIELIINLKTVFSNAAYYDKIIDRISNKQALLLKK